MAFKDPEKCRAYKRFWKKHYRLARHCYNCQKIFWARPDRLRESAGKYCSRECMWEFGNVQKGWEVGTSMPESTRKKLSDCQKGEKHYNWKGGITKERVRLVNTNEYRRWRMAVFERDGYSCRKCGRHGGYLNAHHIIEFANEDTRLDIDNGLTACRKCHWLLHFLSKLPALDLRNKRREFGEPPVERRGNTEPSGLWAEGVETMHGALKSEDIVQTTNVMSGGESHSGMGAIRECSILGSFRKGLTHL